MSLDCNASFVAYALLSSFIVISEKERDAVQFIIELIPCYDEVMDKLRIEFDAHVLAQIYLAELRVLASRHSYVHDGSLEEVHQARALLNVVVMPLIRHLGAEEYNDLVESLEEAHLLLASPLDELNELVTLWRIRNNNITADWRTRTVADLENYEFGVELPGESLEDLLAPLPYPLKSISAPATEYTSDEPGAGLAEHRAQSINSNRTSAPPRSECAKALELKEKDKTNSNVLAIPLLGRSRGSSDSRSEYSHTSRSSAMSWISVDEKLDKEFQGLTNDQETNHPARAVSQENNRAGKARSPRRERFSRYMKSLFKQA